MADLAQWAASREASRTADDLYGIDWVTPGVFYGTAIGLVQALVTGGSGAVVGVFGPILVMGLIHAQLARADALLALGRYAEANWACTQLNLAHRALRLPLAPAVEATYFGLLWARVALLEAEDLYKKLGQSTDEDERARAAYQKAVARLQERGFGKEVERVQRGAGLVRGRATRLLKKTFHPRAEGEERLTPADRRKLMNLGLQMPLSGVRPHRGGQNVTTELVVSPQERLIKSDERLNSEALRVATLATLRLHQIRTNRNYLGYPNDYVPPFRFRHLLERARYFAEHARGVERDYLNFLSTFEREEALERTVRQVVSLEKANIRIETQRVEQERLGIQAAKQSKELADLAESNSRGRLLDFQRFDKECDSLDRWSKRATIIGTLARVGSAIVQNVGKGPIGAFTAIAESASAVSNGLAQYNELLVRGKQRDLEATNLLRASKEAAQQAAVAQAQIAVAKEGLAIGTLQRSAAILRHEQAVTNADAMAGRLLNAEMWARLAQQMREVSETYLKRAVEIAFLAEQAYEFEADREVNVIRFDYDTSREASLLAADFLLADLDSLENDLLTAQTTRQQQVELVFSLANECPIALEELRREGTTVFSLTLERLERRFPGLYNLRIMSIDLRIDGLVDTRGFAAELTHFGSSMVRTKGPAASRGRRRARTWLWEALETIHGDRYASATEAAWPVRTRTFGPESWVFTGMSALERENVFGWTNVGQRNVFEGLGAAASFHLELSHGANSFDPRALYDVTLRLHLVGYADPALKEQIELAARRPDVRTQLLSVKQVFGDAWFEFQETGRLALQVRAESMVLHGRVGRLRNLGLILHPEVDLQSSEVMATGVLDLRVTEEGAVEVLYSSPEVRATASEGTISLAASAPGSTISFRVNDDLAVHAGPTAEVPAAEGATTITTLVARSSELSEHRTRVLVPGPGGRPLAVSATVVGAPPTAGVVKATFRIETTEAVEELSVRWQHVGDDRTAEGREAELELEPGRHLVAYTVVRKLVARVYSHQRHLPDTTLEMNDLVLRTERRYEPDGTPTPGDENAFTQHLLGGSSISPTDLWHIDLRPEDNPALAHRDGQRTDVGWCSDVFLFLEYEVNG